jgi:hypothetical protein
MSDECGLVMPDEPMIKSWKETSLACMRQQGHKGDHLSQNAEGKFFLWAFETEYCGNSDSCTCMGDDGPIECFNYRQITKKEAITLLQKTLTKS